MKNYFLFLILVILVSACNPTILIKNKDLSYIKMIKNIDGGKVSIKLQNGKTLKGKITKFTLDSIFINSKAISMHNISKIIHTKKSKDLNKILLYCSLFGSSAAISAELADDPKGIKIYSVLMFPLGLISDFTNKKDEYILKFNDQSASDTNTN